MSRQSVLLVFLLLLGSTSIGLSSVSLGPSAVQYASTTPPVPGIDGPAPIEGFDIVKAAGGAKRSVVKEFNEVLVQDILEIVLSSKDPESPHKPVLCGLELTQANRSIVD